MDATLFTRQIPLLNVSSEAMADLASAFEEEILVQGQTLFEQGQQRSETNLLLEGEIDLIAELGEISIPMIIFEPFDIISASSLFDANGAHRQTARVRSVEARVANISMERFRGVCSRFPEIEGAFLSFIVRTTDERLEHANRKLLSLVAVGKQVSASVSYEELGRGITMLLTETMRCQKAILLRYFIDRWVLASAVGFNDDEAHWKIGGVIANDALLTALQNKHEPQWLAGPQAASLEHYQAKELLAVPCIQNHQIVGALVIGDRPNGGFSTNTMLHMETVATIVTGGLTRLAERELKRGQEELEQRYILPFS